MDDWTVDLMRVNTPKEKGRPSGRPFLFQSATCRACSEKGSYSRWMRNS